MLAGLIAGSVAALVASLVSLPLRSPLDLAFNTLTITLASLVVGTASGLLWKTLADNPRRPLYYAGGLAAAFVVVAVVALVGNMWVGEVCCLYHPTGSHCVRTVRDSGAGGWRHLRRRSPWVGRGVADCIGRVGRRPRQPGRHRERRAIAARTG